MQTSRQIPKEAIDLIERLTTGARGLDNSALSFSLRTVKKHPAFLGKVL